MRSAALAILGVFLGLAGGSVRAAGPLTPVREWNAERAAHLLRRAGFGGTPRQVQFLTRLGAAAAVDYLVHYQQIGQSDADFVKFTEAKNWDALAMLYTEDCVVMPPGAPMVFGRDAAIELFVPLTVTNFTLTTQEAQARGDLGYSRGTYVWTVLIGDGEPMTDTGKWVVVWKHINGQWLLHQDIWNSDEGG